MGDLTVARWRKFGHDRLYVKTAAGLDVGWIDLRTWAVTLQLEDRGNDFHAAVAGFCASNDVAMPDVTRPPEPEPPSIAEEAEHWLSQASTAPQIEPYAIKIDWRDTARNAAGQRAAEQAAALRAAAPVRTFVNRLLGTHTDERAWRAGSDGERLVAAELATLPKTWRVLHAVEVGDRRADIDHIVIGPAGVFTINTKHHLGKKVWVGGNTFLVSGQRQPYVRNARHEAQRAARLLTAAVGFEVPVQPVLAVVNAEQLTIKEQPAGVHVVARKHLCGWLRTLPATWAPEGIEQVSRAARKSTTWTKAPA